MRRSEICAIKRANIYLMQGIILVLETKNGHPRLRPLTINGYTAVKILLAYSKGDYLVDMTPNAIRLSFERIRSRAALRQIKFHHLQHETLSWFFEMGLTPPEVASISGHRTFKQLMRYSHAMEDRVKRIVQGQLTRLQCPWVWRSVRYPIKIIKLENRQIHYPEAEQTGQKPYKWLFVRPALPERHGKTPLGVSGVRRWFADRSLSRTISIFIWKSYAMADQIFFPAAPKLINIGITVLESHW